MANQRNKKPSSDDPLDIVTNMHQNYLRQATLDFSGETSTPQAESDDKNQTKNRSLQSAQSKELGNKEAMEIATQIRQEVLAELLDNNALLPHPIPNTAVMPNELLRSSLFSARNRHQKRKFLKYDPIATLGNFQISYYGEELRQDDCDIYMKLIEIASRQAPPDLSIAGNNIKNPEEFIAFGFTRYGLAKEMGRSPHNSFNKRLIESLDRLRFGGLIIESNSIAKNTKGRSQRLALNLMDYVTRETRKKGQNYENTLVCFIPKALILLMGNQNYTRVQWSKRLSLKSNIAKWLINFYSSHRKPLPVTLDNLCDAAGINIQRRTDARKLVRTAHKQLLDCGFLSDFNIEDDRITVTRAPIKDWQQLVERLSDTQNNSG